MDFYRPVDNRSQSFLMRLCGKNWLKLQVVKIEFIIKTHTTATWYFKAIKACNILHTSEAAGVRQGAHV